MNTTNVKYSSVPETVEAITTNATEIDLKTSFVSKVSLEHLTQALTHLIEGNEEAGISFLKESAKLKNRIAVLILSLKQIPSPSLVVENLEPQTTLQTIERLFWELKYDESFKLALKLQYNPSIDRKIASEASSWSSASWFVKSSFNGTLDVDKDKIIANNAVRLLVNKDTTPRDDLRIETALARATSDVNYQIDRSISDLNQVQDPAYLKIAQLLKQLFHQRYFIYQ